jgi:transcriptional regulator
MKGEIHAELRGLRDGSVDAGLAMLALVTPRGVTRSQEEIAAACGCSVQNIQHIERRALKKIRAAFERRGLPK